MSDRDGPEDAVDIDAYCRAVEAHLCRKNDGHLIRVSGPAFDLVRGWAEQGIPLNVTLRGIDRTFERYYRKGPRRRPLPVSFCDADVLDTFDEWRRALGLHLAAPETGAAEPQAADADRTRRGGSLPAHLERLANRLTLLRGLQPDPAFESALERTVREIDAARGGSRSLRGHAREALLARLAALDDELVSLARAQLAADRLDAIGAQAAAELAGFRERMPPASYEAAVSAAAARLVREAVGLPVLRYEG